MNATEIVKTGWAAIERGDIPKASTYLAEDFQFSGPVPKPLHKQEFMKMMQALIAGVPDWKFNARNMEAHGHTVEATVQPTGTHTRLLSGLMPGMPDAPPTGKSFKLSPEHVRITLRGDKILSIQTDPVPGGGIPGMLQQLGIVMPARP